MSLGDRATAPIERMARHAERRIRAARTVRAAASATCGALVFALALVSLRKLGAIGEAPARWLLGGAAASVAVFAAIAWTRRLPARAGARALDRFHGYSDRLSSALAFADRPAGDVTPLMRAAIDDALAFAPRARPARAVPVGLPRSSGAVIGLSILLCAVMLFEVRTHPIAPHARTIDPVYMAPDDLDDVKDFLGRVEQRPLSDDTKAAVEEFNRLIQDIANRRLDRTEAFRRLASLEQKLLTGSAADKKALEGQMESIGAELKKADLARPAGAALSEDRLPGARDAFHEMARKLRGAAGPVDKSKLDALRQALKKAAQLSRDRQSELDARRERLADEILKSKEKLRESDSDEERSLLDKKTQELERLDRESDAQRDAGQQLDRLDRELEQAAQDLMKDLGLSANDLDQGAEDLNRMDQSQASEQEKQELRQKLQELRELLRQQGQAGKAQMLRLMRFGRMARGQGGEGQSGRTGDGPSGSQGDGPQQNPSGQGQPGQSSGGPQNGGTWIVGPNGQKILMLSSAPRSSGSSSDPGGPGSERSPARWGEGHDPKLQGKATNPAMGTEDTQVRGAASGQGATRSQVILGAAERGFASRGYQKVYTEYHQVAEESLARDDIPGGYRFYVKRYFELIRPRESP